MAISRKKTNKSLKELMKQDKKRLSEYCSKKYFNKIVTLEEALESVLQWDEIKKALKTMTVASKASQINNINGEIRLVLTFSNDDCAKAEIKLGDMLEDIIKKI